MNNEKRSWLYAGIAVAAGVGLVTMTTSEVGALGADDDGCRRLRCLKDKRVLLLGDAMGDGLALPLKKLAEGSKTDLVSACRSGVNVADWPALLDKEGLLAKVKPTLVLVAIGPADLRKKDTSIDADAMARLTKKLRDAGAVVIWVGPPKMPVEDWRIRESIRAIGGMYPSEALTIARGPDGLRPTAAGFAGWAGALWRWIA